MISNLFGSLGLDSTLKRMLNVVARFSFDNVGRLRVYADAAVSLNSNQTLTTANISAGDMGKNNTAIAQSIQTVATVRKNWK